MSDHSWSAENILGLFPPVLAEDTRMLALGKVIAGALAARLEEAHIAEIYTRIDTLQEGVLDILATDLAISWWDASWPIERKRQTIRDSWAVHKRMGTADSLGRAVTAAFGSGRVEEWFSYGGMPHHFRVTGLSPEVFLSGYDTFLKLLAVVKRESSVMDGVTLLHVLRGGSVWDGSIATFRRTVLGDGIDIAVYIADERGDYLLDEYGNLILDEEANT